MEAFLNKDLSDKLNELATLNESINQHYKAKAFKNASDLIANYPTKILTGKEARENIKGIGKSISEIIDEYNLTGKIDRLDHLKSENQSKIKFDPLVIDLFTTIYGIGPVAAEKFYLQGFRTIEDLWFKAELTESQKSGILWKDHINLRIPRAEMDIINKYLKAYLTPNNIKWTIAGSYRREEESSGDVDVLIEKLPNLNMEDILYLLKDILPVTLSKGETKFMGIIRINDSFNGHRIDIRLIEPENYPVALLYFTGSKEFNILIRKRALDLNMSLNEYKLTNLPLNETINSEEDIFRILKISYVPPNKRKSTKNYLELIEI